MVCFPSGGDAAGWEVLLFPLERHAELEAVLDLAENGLSKQWVAYQAQGTKV
jgi:hypothetical protein